jgi:hypothetical protein
MRRYCISIPWCQIGFFLLYTVGIGLTLSGLSSLEQQLSEYSTKEVSFPYFKVVLPWVETVNFITVIFAFLSSPLFRIKKSCFWKWFHRFATIIQIILFILIELSVALLISVCMIGISGYLLFLVLETICSSAVAEFDAQVSDIVRDYIDDGFETTVASSFCADIGELGYLSRQILIGAIVMTFSEIQLLVCTAKFL